MPHQQRTLEEREMIKNQLYENWKSDYNWMFPSYQLPEPKKGPSMSNVDLSVKQMAQVSIPDLQKSVMIGTILGDTSFSIQTHYRNPRMQNRHSTRQASWFFWKWFVCLKDFNNGLSSVTFQDSDGFQQKSSFCLALQGQSKGPLPEEGENLGKLKINSKANAVLMKLHEVICENNKKKNRKKMVKSYE